MGAVGVAGLSGCGPRVGTAGNGVLAAGQPAAVLVWCLAPGRLLGWPRQPTAETLAMLPARAAALPQIGALTSGGGPANLEAMAALRPALVIDYGDTDPAYVAIGERLRERLGADWRLIDGDLTRSPQALVEAGNLLGVSARGAQLADRVASVLDAWSGGPQGPAFYYARGGDGLETAFAGALGTEVLEGAGWANVAVGGRDIGRVTREQVAAWDPEAIVTLDAGFANRIAGDPLWRRRRNGGRRRLLLLPEAPFGWVDRPPSINRLLGCAWLGGRPFAADQRAPAETIRDLARTLYGAPAAPAPFALPRWIA